MQVLGWHLQHQRHVEGLGDGQLHLVSGRVEVPEGGQAVDNEQRWIAVVVQRFGGAGAQCDRENADVVVLVKHVMIVRGRRHRILVRGPVGGLVLALAGVEKCHGWFLPKRAGQR